MPAYSANGQTITGLCLGPSYLFVSKVAADGEKDIEFVKTMIEYCMVDYDCVLQLASHVSDPLDDLGRSVRIFRPN